MEVDHYKIYITVSEHYYIMLLKEMMQHLNHITKEEKNANLYNNISQVNIYNRKNLFFFFKAYFNNHIFLYLQ